MCDKHEICITFLLNNRSIALRNIRERAKFKIQEGVVRGFRDFLYEQGFTEIHTPKIGAKGAEGGANMFRMDYFHRPAVLAQSPQLYKQMMVGVFDRVFETAPVFRAEKHNTKRHLNEEEKEQAKKDMGAMLDYIDKLNELDTTGVEPMSHVFPVTNVFREDVVTNGDGSEATLSNAPSMKDSGFKVPKTIG